VVGTVGFRGKKLFIDMFLQLVWASLQKIVNQLNERDLGKEDRDNSDKACATESDDSVPCVLGLNVINLSDQLLKLFNDLLLHQHAIGRDL